MDVGDIEFRRLSDKLGNEWEKLATFLGFNQAKIEQLQMEYANRNIDHAIFDMLVSWRKLQPKSTNYRAVLKGALEECGRKDLADAVASDSPGAKLEEINSILHGKLTSNREVFQSAVFDFFDGLVSITTDDQLAAAMSGFGKEYREKGAKKKEKEDVIKWQQVQKIDKRTSQNDAFHSVTKVALQSSGDIAVIDKNDKVADLWSSNRGSPRVYVFNPDGAQKFVLNSTEADEKPVGKLVNAQGVAVTLDGKYAVADGTTNVKLFDNNGEYLDSFSTLSEDSSKGTRALTTCIAVNTGNGDVLVGDHRRELVTVHSGDDFKLIKEVHVGLQPVHIAVNKKNQILVCMMMHEPAEVVAVNILFRVLKQTMAGGKVVAFDYSGDEVFTIVPVISDELAKPYGVAFDSDDGIYMAVSKFDVWSRLAKPNTGHIHYYNSSGEFVKCVAKGLHWPLGMALRNGVLAVADKVSVKIYKPE